MHSINARLNSQDAFGRHRQRRLHTPSLNKQKLQPPQHDPTSSLRRHPAWGSLGQSQNNSRPRRQCGTDKIADCILLKTTAGIALLSNNEKQPHDQVPGVRAHDSGSKQLPPLLRNSTKASLPPPAITRALLPAPNPSSNKLQYYPGRIRSKNMTESSTL